MQGDNDCYTCYYHCILLPNGPNQSSFVSYDSNLWSDTSHTIISSLTSLFNKCLQPLLSDFLLRQPLLFNFFWDYAILPYLCHYVCVKTQYKPFKILSLDKKIKVTRFFSLFFISRNFPFWMWNNYTFFFCHLILLTGRSPKQKPIQKI